MLRLDGAIPFDSIQELTEEELYAQYEEFCAYSEAKERALKAQAPKNRK